jgi:hypothetical protein
MTGGNPSHAETRAVVALTLAIALLGCKKPVSTTDEVTAVSTVPIASSAPPTATGIVNPGMADLTQPPDPPPPPEANIGETPAALPADTGTPPNLKIAPVKVTFPKGMMRDAVIELKSDGSLVFDGKKLGKLVGNKASITKPAQDVVLRSDGYTTSSINPNYLTETADTISSPQGASSKIMPNGSIMVSVGGPPQEGGKVTANLKDPEILKTATFVVAIEYARPPDFEALQKQMNAQLKAMGQGH